MVKACKTKLKILLSVVENKARWHEYTKMAAMTINNTIKPSIGYSPKELFFAIPPFMDGFSIYGPDGSATHGRLADLMAMRQKFFDTINREKWGTVDPSTPRSIPPSFNPGDRVFVRNFVLHLSPLRNLEPKFTGPFSIIKRLNTYSYLVSKGGDEITVHVNNLRPYDPEFDPDKLIHKSHSDASGPDLHSKSDPDLSANDILSGQKSGAESAGRLRPRRSLPPLPPDPPLPLTTLKPPAVREQVKRPRSSDSSEPINSKSKLAKHT